MAPIEPTAYSPFQADGAIAARELDEPFSGSPASAGRGRVPIDAGSGRATGETNLQIARQEIENSEQVFEAGRSRSRRPRLRAPSSRQKNRRTCR
jgi:hypothetical protein